MRRKAGANRPGQNWSPTLESCLGLLAFVAFGLAAQITGHLWLAVVGSLAFAGAMTRLAHKSGQRRKAALSELAERAPCLSMAERQREIDKIIWLYGGDFWPSTRRAIEDIRSR